MSWASADVGSPAHDGVLATHPSGAASAGTRGGAPGTWDAAWVEALAELELTVDLAEQMLERDHGADVAQRTGWVPPQGLGPLPAPLVDRARMILERQIEVAQRLAEAAARSRRHAEAARAMRSAPPALPVYVDTPA